MNFWKQAYLNMIKQNYKSLQLMYYKNAYPLHLQLPKKLETTEEILKFSKEINSYIAFAEIHIVNHRM